jgi:hypothetical protein
MSLRAERSNLPKLQGLPVGPASETVSEFFVNPKSCHDIDAETEPTGCRMLLQLAVDSKQPLYGAGLKPALGRISKERAGLKPAPTPHRATILAEIILRQFHPAGHFT